MNKLQRIYETYLSIINPEKCKINELAFEMTNIFQKPNNTSQEFRRFNDPVVFGVMYTANRKLLENIESNNEFIKANKPYQLRVIFYKNKEIFTSPKMRIYYSGPGWKYDRPKMEFIDFLMDLNIDHNKLSYIFEKHIFEHMA